VEIVISQRKHFTQEKKNSIVAEHLSSGIPVSVLARKYGIHAITLYGWKRNMNRAKNSDEKIDSEFIRNLIEENDKLRSENKNLLAKVGEFSIRNDILKDAVSIAQKKVILNALPLPKKSKHINGMK
jgi:transposase-like protein